MVWWRCHQWSFSFKSFCSMQNRNWAHSSLSKSQFLSVQLKSRFHSIIDNFWNWWFQRLWSQGWNFLLQSQLTSSNKPRQIRVWHLSNLEWKCHSTSSHSAIRQRQRLKAICLWNSSTFRSSFWRERASVRSISLSQISRWFKHSIRCGWWLSQHWSWQITR